MVSILIGLASAVVFIYFQAQGIPAGDSGDLVTAAATFGVAHPPGYPLYTFLGWLGSKIPLLTVSWRVGLLSSLPHVLVLIIVYRLVYHLTKRTSAAFFSCLVLAGNYVFFLYSVTPEVFAILDLFAVVMMYMVLRWEETGETRMLYSLAFVSGLSLTHHHMILFLFPVIWFVLWRKRKKIPHTRKFFFRLFCVFALGIVPYAYVFVAARGTSIINWDHVTSLSNFVRLVSRADYGTFQSGVVMGALPIQRLIQVKLFVQYIFIDFTFLGAMCILAGFWYLWLKKRLYFYVYALSVTIMGPLFLFYASFPLSSRFTLATYERFLLPAYTFLAIVSGIGFSYLLGVAEQRSRKMHIGRIVPIGFYAVGFIFAFSALLTTGVKFWGYAGDRTAEYLAHDVLFGLPPDSLLVADRDTVLFTTQYIRYVEAVRPDVIVVHGSMLSSEDYRVIVARIFPRLSRPPVSDESYISHLLTQNASKRGVFSYIRYKTEAGWFWVPHGLVYQLIQKTALPSVDQMKADNLRMWNAFHSPDAGILSHYNHLMLSDVRDVYTSSRVEFGKTILKAGDIEIAKNQFAAAIGYGGDAGLPEAYMYLGLSELFLNHCDEALSAFAKSRSLSLAPDRDLTLYESKTYEDCKKDPKVAKELYDAYLKTQESGKTLLKEL
jgi:hypothetical protein